MLQNPCKTLGIKKNMVYKFPLGVGKPYLASGLLCKTFSCRAAFMHMFFLFVWQNWAWSPAPHSKAFHFLTVNINTSQSQMFHLFKWFDSNCNCLKFIRIWLESNRSIKVRPSFSKVFFFQDVYFPVPVRDCVIICIVVDLAMSAK